MRIFAQIIFSGLYFIAPLVAMANDDFYYVPNGTVYSVSHPGAIIIDTVSPTIENHGVFDVDVTLGTGFSLNIKNYDTITGNFTCEDPGGCIYVTQIVTGVVDEHGHHDIHRIQNLVGHNVVASGTIDNPVNINMADLIDTAQNANGIYLSSARIDVGANMPEFTHPIYIGDASVVFVVTDIPTDSSVPLLSDVRKGSHPLHVEFDGIDPMFVPSHEWRGNDLYVNVARQTNYSVVFGGALGDYLDGLRAKNPNDKLLNALDSQMSRDSMRNVLSGAARTNPINLMRPILRLGTHDSMLFFPGTAIAPFYMFAKDFYAIGGHINIGGEFGDNLYGSVGLVGGVINAASDYDDFTGILYGGNVGVQYMDDDYYLDASGTFSYTSFDDVDVFHDDKVFHNPGGIGVNFMSDFGVVYKLYEDMNLNLIPFVGARADYVAIAQQDDSDLNLRIGAKAEKTDDTDGNKYAIGGKLFVQTDRTIYGAFYVDMLSVADGVGGGLEIGVAHDDFGMSYKFALGGKIIF